MIEVRNLSFQYKKTSPLLLRNLSFKIPDGQILTIIGKNGVGKTTFLRCLTGELKHFDGDILIDEKDVRDLSVNELSHKIAVVASNNPCYQNLSVADFLVTGFANKLTAIQAPNKEQYIKASEILDELCQIELLNRKIFELSSGELQIVKIARAILQNPKIVVFDEPTSNLDIRNQLMVLNQITNLAKRGYTIITTTHNPGQSIELGGNVLMLTGDRQIFGEAENVLTEENLKAVYELNVTIEEGIFRNYTSFQDSTGVHRLIF